MTTGPLHRLSLAGLEPLWRAARTGLGWWGRELALLVPPALARRLHRPLAIVWLQPEGVRWGRLQHGHCRPAPASDGASALLVLPAEEVLEARVELPAALTPDDAQRLLALELDRYTPFPAAAALYSLDPAGTDGGSQRPYALTVLPRPRALDLARQAAAAGVRLDGFVVAGPDGRARQRLPAPATVGIGLRAQLRRHGWWGGVVLLLLANLGLLLGRDMAGLAALETEVASQRDLAARAAGLRRSVEEEEARRATLLRDKQAAAPLPLLEAVASALPDGAWVLRLEWDPAGPRLHLVGEADPAIDVLALIEASPRLEQAQTATAAPAATAGKRPFDITLRPESSP
ncbi:PilN domain-containing protein [Oleisolibacter albus]|uniref:PilN domain-containing protein n=1 Tax=Oleisolibacter albus TaxID=2171757 RepID=UPI00138FFA5A|nr:PilN domain-containing protein [Oleisolibacter albus]